MEAEFALPVVSPEEMYLLDQIMVDKYHISPDVLMENASSSVVRLLLQTFSDLGDKQIVLFIGPGKNGEDALVLARQLAIRGIATEAFLLPPIGKQDRSYQEKVECLHLLEVKIYHSEIPDLSIYDIVIDGIFGIGLSRPPAGIYSESIKAINLVKSNEKTTIISLDIPSGVYASDGHIENETAVFCDYCVSFGSLKIGNVLYYGYTHCKFQYLSTLQAPYLEELGGNPHSTLVNLPVPMPERDKAGYKNSFGRGLVIGGSRSYHGAPHFVVSGFLKSGGGYCHLVSPSEVASSVAVLSPECVLHPVSPSVSGTLPRAAFQEIIGIAKAIDILVIGSGLGQSKDTTLLVQDILQAQELGKHPLIIDGDALTILSNELSLLTKRIPYTTILTPHLGEMARLTGRPTAQIERDLIGTATEFARQWKVLLVLKGPRSIIVTADHTYINTAGTNALATAGSGDVLAGIIAAFCVTPLDLENGLRNAVFFHGMIGNYLSERKEDLSSSATDILNAIPKTFPLFADLAIKNEKNQRPFDIPGLRFFD